jgi:hypothetical protein
VAKVGVLRSERLDEMAALRILVILQVRDYVMLVRIELFEVAPVRFELRFSLRVDYLYRKLADNFTYNKVIGHCSAPPRHFNPYFN